PGAIAKLDGVPLAESPFVAHPRRDGSMHRIDVEGPGFKSETKMVSYEKDVAVTVSLTPRDPEPAQSATAAAAGANKRPAGSGTARPKPAKPGFGIDEKDPYKQ